MTHKQIPGEAGNRPDGDAATLARLITNVTINCAALPPSSERVLKFVENVLQCPRSNRLKTLAIRAALTTIASRAGGVDCVVIRNGQPDPREQVEWNDSNRGRSLYCHTTGTVSVATIHAMIPTHGHEENLAHIVLVTTDRIDPEVHEYASSVYQQTNGIEFAILDCLGFVHHFIHLFHRHRIAFLDAYRALVLNEPESAVSFALKQAFFYRTVTPPVAGRNHAQ